MNRGVTFKFDGRLLLHLTTQRFPFKVKEHEQVVQLRVAEQPSGLRHCITGHLRWFESQ